MCYKLAFFHSWQTPWDCGPGSRPSKQLSGRPTGLGYRQRGGKFAGFGRPGRLSRRNPRRRGCGTSRRDPAGPGAVPAGAAPAGTVPAGAGSSSPVSSIRAISTSKKLPWDPGQVAGAVDLQLHLVARLLALQLIGQILQDGDLLVIDLGDDIPGDDPFWEMSLPSWVEITNRPVGPGSGGPGASVDLLGGGAQHHPPGLTRP